MKTVLAVLTGVAAASLSAAGEPAITQVLERVAPVLAEGEAYHTASEAREGLEPLTLTPDQCVAIALEHNAEALLAETEVALREAEAGQARARRKPRVTAEAVYNYVEELDFSVGGGFLGGFIDTETFSPQKETVTTRLTLSQVLFAGGQIHAAVKASKYLAASEAWRRDAVRAEVAFRARQSYHDALAARADLAVAEEAREAFERHQRDTEILEREGALTTFEVMRAKTEVAARNADLASARAAVELADLAVRRLLALPENQPLRYDGTAETDLAPYGGAPLPLALERRPELRALAEALRAAEQQQRVVRGKYLPEIGATATWVDIDGGGQSQPDGWQVNIAAQWDLYAGGQRKHERAEARARTEGLQLELADMERQVAAEVTRAGVQIDEAKAALRARKENVDLAAESVRLAKIRYGEGIGTQTELLDTELELARANSALVRAARNYHVARASLVRAVGEVTPASTDGE